MTAQQFKMYRQRVGLNQEEFGLAIGLTRVSVNRIENGHQAITDDIAVKVGVTVALFKKGGLR